MGFKQKKIYPPLNGVQALEVPDSIFFLTDYVCVSACLDFADLILSLPNVTHIGQETSADTKYLEQSNKMLETVEKELKQYTN